MFFERRSPPSAKVLLNGKGVTLPDLLVFNSEVARGAGKGLKLAGFIGTDWGVESGEFLSDGAAPAAKDAAKKQ